MHEPLAAAALRAGCLPRAVAAWSLQRPRLLQRERGAVHVQAGLCRCRLLHPVVPAPVQRAGEVRPADWALRVRPTLLGTRLRTARSRRGRHGTRHVSITAVTTTAMAVVAAPTPIPIFSSALALVALPFAALATAATAALAAAATASTAKAAAASAASSTAAAHRARGWALRRAEHLPLCVRSPGWPWRLPRRNVLLQQWMGWRCLPAATVSGGAHRRRRATVGLKTM